MFKVILYKVTKYNVWFEKGCFLKSSVFHEVCEFVKSHGLTNVITKETKSHSSTKQIYFDGPLC